MIQFEVHELSEAVIARVLSMGMEVPVTATCLAMYSLLGVEFQPEFLQHIEPEQADELRRRAAIFEATVNEAAATGTALAALVALGKVN